MAQQAAAPPAAKPPEDQGFIAAAGRWFDEQFDWMGKGFSGAGKTIMNFGHEAGIAARTTADGAKDAADAVARMSNGRVVTGHEVCQTAPNGAPDCVAAANTVCKAKGFSSGKSMDMTVAENCPAKVYIAGRSSDAGCTTITFVSRAFCQ
jgi:hypothetical protein